MAFWFVFHPRWMAFLLKIDCLQAFFDWRILNIVRAFVLGYLIVYSMFLPRRLLWKFEVAWLLLVFRSNFREVARAQLWVKSFFTELSDEITIKVSTSLFAEIIFGVTFVFLFLNLLANHRTKRKCTFNDRWTVLTFEVPKLFGYVELDWTKRIILLSWQTCIYLLIHINTSYARCVWSWKE